MNNNDIPVWEKYTLTIEEASKYFRIGENKLRRLAEENKDAVQIPLHRITDSASNGSVFPVVTEHFSASSDHAFL